MERRVDKKVDVVDKYAGRIRSKTWNDGIVILHC